MIRLPSFGPQVWLRRNRGSVVFDADALTLIAAMSTEPDATRKLLISDTITSLKAAGIWTKLDELWFLAAHAEQAALLGWKRYKDCVAVNAPTFTTDEGFAGNGSTSYLNTQFVPSTDGVNYTLNDASFGVYSLTDVQQSAIDMGSNDGGDAAYTRVSLWQAVSGNQIASVHLALNGGGASFAVGNSLGFGVSRRSAANEQQAFRNGSQIVSNSTSPSAIPNHSMFIGARNNNGTPSDLSTRQYAFAFVGASLTEQQQASLFTIVESYLDAIGAGVVA